jgi:riboflavin kinase/FMN adenylyltransferase
VPRSHRKLIPGRGVYFVSVILEGKEWFGMMNIGRRPTFSQQPFDTLEVNIFSMDRDIYGAEVGISFLKRLREERRFSSERELTLQLDKDREASLQYLSEFKKHDQ